MDRAGKEKATGSRVVAPAPSYEERAHFHVLARDDDTAQIILTVQLSDWKRLGGALQNRGVASRTAR